MAKTMKPRQVSRQVSRPAGMPTVDADKAMSRAMSRMVMQQPWFAALALRLKVQADPSVPTAGVDGVNLIYNSEWFADLDPAFQLGVLAHEVMHCALLHMTRRGARDPKMWNIAGDHVINLELMEAGFRLPEGCYADPRFKGMHTEAVYAQLAQENPHGMSGDEGFDLGQVMDAPGDGQGPGDDDGKDGKAGGSGGSKGDLEVEWSKAVSAATMVAAKAGKVPAGMERTIKARESKNNWREVLQRYLVLPGDFSWARPARRYVAQGRYLPGQVIDHPGRIVIAVDTSGSISAHLLDVFAGEVNALLACAGWPEAVHVVYCDAVVNHTEEVPEGGPVEFKACGGGGTAAGPVFEEVQAQGWDPMVLFYLTDLWLSDTAELTDPGYAVVWIVPEGAHGKAPEVGEVATIDVNEERREEEV